MTKYILRLNTGDATVSAALKGLKAAGAATVLTIPTVGQLEHAKKGDTLVVLAHGDTTHVDKYTARDLASVLEKAGLKSGVAIDVVACESGSSGAPFALELKNQLVQHKIIPSKVSGGTGEMWVTKGGRPFARDESGARKQAGKVQEETPWGTRTRNVDPRYETR